MGQNKEGSLCRVERPYSPIHFSKLHDFGYQKSVPLVKERMLKERSRFIGRSIIFMAIDNTNTVASTKEFGTGEGQLGNGAEVAGNYPCECIVVKCQIAKRGDGLQFLWNGSSQAIVRYVKRNKAREQPKLFGAVQEENCSLEIAHRDRNWTIALFAMAYVPDGIVPVIILSLK